jgi:catechol 2,3-dioxygenase-like lactoylglutathione lyase family enzyme
MPPSQEEVARSFYGGILGLAEVAKPASLAQRGGLWFEQGELKVHLGVEQAFQPARKAHPAFLVEGLDELIERCQQAGYKVTSDEPIAGYNRVHVTDPFGNRIELLEPTSGR